MVSFCIIARAGGKLALLFVDGSEEAILSNVKLFLLCNSIFYFPLSLVNNIRFLIQGMGYSMLAILSGVSEMIDSFWFLFSGLRLWALQVLWPG